MDISKKKRPVDQDAVNNGVWVFYDEDTELKICSRKKSEYRKCLERLSKPYRAAFRAGHVPEKQMTEIASRAMAKHLLVDWRGMKDSSKLDENDEPTDVPYSEDTAFELLVDDEDFRQFVDDAATDQDAFLQAEEQEGIDNLKKS